MKGMSRKDALFAAACAAYHDCGRSLGYKQDNHADAVPVEKLFPLKEAEQARRIMSCHNSSSEQMTGIVENGPASVTADDLMVAKIVHDADSLDYLRLTVERGIKHYDPTKLILPEAFALIPMAFELFVLSYIDPKWIINLFMYDKMP
jgi:hypothetical protein